MAKPTPDVAELIEQLRERLATYEHTFRDELDDPVCAGVMNIEREVIDALASLSAQLAVKDAALRGLVERITDAWPELANLPPMIAARAAISPQADAALGDK